MYSLRDHALDLEGIAAKLPDKFKVGISESCYVPSLSINHHLFSMHVWKETRLLNLYPISTLLLGKIYAILH